MRKAIYLIYSIVCYGIFLGVFLYMVGFVENINTYSIGQSLSRYFPQTLDTGTADFKGITAVLINLSLIALFGIQHSVMARKSFKEWWTRIVPKPLERSTYVLFASLALIVLYIFWQPIKFEIWNFQNSSIGMTLLGISLFGWILLLYSTYLINHFDLFGLRQTYLHAIDRDDLNKLKFQKPGLYKVIRHPIYFSFLLIFWFAPIMTLGHLLFATGMTAYIYIGIYHEERSLIKEFGDNYRQYRNDVPKIIPFAKFSKR